MTRINKQLQKIADIMCDNYNIPKIIVKKDNRIKGSGLFKYDEYSAICIKYTENEDVLWYVFTILHEIGHYCWYFKCGFSRYRKITVVQREYLANKFSYNNTKNKKRWIKIYKSVYKLWKNSEWNYAAKSLNMVFNDINRES